MKYKKFLAQIVTMPLYTSRNLPHMPRSLLMYNLLWLCNDIARFAFFTKNLNKNCAFYHYSGKTWNQQKLLHIATTKTKNGSKIKL